MIRRGAATAVVLGASFALAGACAPARPGTTYEAYNYVVTIPDDLGLKPSVDEETIWITGLKGLTLQFASADFIDIQIREIERQPSDREAAMQAARDAIERTGVQNVVGPTEHAFPAGAGAVFETTDPSNPFSVAYVAAGDRFISVLGSGLSQADLITIVESFRLKDPPDDPLRPPNRPSATTGT